MKIQLLVILGALLTAMQVTADDKTQLTQETRGAIKALAAELKGTLQAAMKSDGPIKAISVCNEQAPKLAQKVSDEKGMEVARTSLKIRNELNAPDAWELAVLEQFEQRKSKGEPVKAIEYSEITQHNGNKVFRYMKAIPADDVCLMCHGEKIPDQLSAKLDQLYPNDQATGFKKGDIRGAFTAVKIID
jgi:septation ring formation regulator EzrA